MKKHDPREQDVVERARMSAVERIREEELMRIEARLESYEIARADAKMQVREACRQFGARYVAQWVLEEAKSLGHLL